MRELPDVVAYGIKPVEKGEVVAIAVVELPFEAAITLPYVSTVIFAFVYESIFEEVVASSINPIALL